MEEKQNDLEARLKLHRRVVAAFRYNPYRDFLAGIELNDLIRVSLWDQLPRESIVSVIGPSEPPSDPKGYVIVADSALNQYNGRYDMLVSDLDGPMERILEDRKSIKVIHAHGDNLDKLRSYVPNIRGIILGTTQSIPLKRVRNIGGFTDGDRSVIMGVILGAKKIFIYGFDFLNPMDEPKEIKKKKMLIGKEVIDKVKNAEIVYVHR